MKIILAFLICVYGPCYSQSPKYKAVKIGDKVPAAIWKTVPKSSSTKLVILDFWATYCASCIKAFPKMVELQNKFKEKVNIVLVNSREELAEVQKKNIKVPPLAALYGQKVFKELFPHGMIPHHVWLDQSGRVLAITSDLYATEQNVEAVLQKKIVEFTLKDDELRDAFHDKMLMKARDASFEGYYSAFFPYNASMPGSNRIVFDSTAGIFWTRLIGIGPFELLKAAFFENTNEMEVKYEMSDTVKIKIYIPSRVSIQQLDWHTKYNYTYELKGDLADFPMWREKAQLDINFFTRKRFGIYARKELDPLTEKYILIISDSMVN